MHAKHEGTAKAPRRLKAVFDGRQAVQRMHFVEEIPHAQIAGARQPHQCVDRQVHPEGQQCAIKREIGVGRGDEQDRTRHRRFLNPAADRKWRRPAGNRIGQEADCLGIGVEDGPDRFRHARSLDGRQRAGDGVGELAVDGLEVGLHQMVRDGAV